MKPVVGVDVDGVLIDMLGPCFALAKEFLGKSLTLGDMTGWEIDHLLEGKASEFWEKFGEEDFHSNHPYPGAVEGIQALHEIADVHIVTAPLSTGKTWTYERDRWISRHFGIHTDKIHYMRSKDRFRGDALIDDRPSNILGWQAANPEGVGILWRHTWNETPGVYEAHNWEDVFRILRSRPA
jgi:5'(3')-deoxyribonucleotidase